MYINVSYFNFKLKVSKMVISLMTQLTTLEICYVKCLTLENRTNKETSNVYKNFR